LTALGSTALTASTVGWFRRPGLALHRWARNLLPRLGVEVTLTAPIPEGGLLWVSNHLSWVDPLIFMGFRPSGALAKAEVAGYPLIGAGALKAGLRFVHRDSLFSRARALRGLRADLRDGLPFLLFPEGTTTAGGTLAPLREGGLRMAYRLGIPVLPFRLEGADAHYPWVGDATLLPHLKALARARRTRVGVHPGRVLDPAAFPDETAFVAAIRAHLSPSAAGLGAA
jgi:1-acyl-sn-glycerol-3-phosphate acyltransferase